MYTGLDDTDRWVLPEVLAENAARRPDAVWIETTTGGSLRFGEAAADADRVAGWFAAQGVVAGEPVALMLGNGLDFVRAWLGATRLGAVAVLLNTELTGAFLRHQLGNCGARLVLADASLLPALREASAQLASPPRVVTVDVVTVGGTGEAGDAADADGAVDALAPGDADDAGDAGDAGGAGVAGGWPAWRDCAPWTGPMPRPRDVACVMYTSGTSGPAKGVLMPHAHCYLFGRGAVASTALEARDRYYVVLPLFHANGLLMQLAATMIAGCTAILRPRFSASAWLADVRAHRATVTNCLGALAAFVVAQPPGPHDRDHALRLVCAAPNPPEIDAAFRGRFGVPDVTSGYGMTEVNIPVWGRVGQAAPGAAGWVDDRYFEVVVADPETDRPLPPGELGELLVRPRVPFGFMAGYHAMPDRTVEAWRNLWFHTGDAATMTADGLVTFVDRIKDCIRRRGENVSATEVEAAVGTLDGVAEVAAYAVPADIAGGEDEVMLAVVPAPGTAIDAAAVAAHADRVLPRFARPRWVAMVDALPKTATGKVQRAVLRRAGTAGAWDRERG
jgi:crotonobetaine/carnitine-CoA ligase